MKATEYCLLCSAIYYTVQHVLPFESMDHILRCDNDVTLNYQALLLLTFKTVDRALTCACNSFVFDLITSSFGSRSICSLEAACRFSAINLLEDTIFSETFSFCCRESAKRSKYLKKKWKTSDSFPPGSLYSSSVDYWFPVLLTMRLPYNMRTLTTRANLKKQIRLSHT